MHRGSGTENSKELQLKTGMGRIAPAHQYSITVSDDLTIIPRNLTKNKKTVFIKLTKDYTTGGEPSQFFINSQQIVWLESADDTGVTAVYAGDSTAFTVLETPEKIIELCHKAATEREFRAIGEAIDRQWEAKD